MFLSSSTNRQFDFNNGEITCNKTFLLFFTRLSMKKHIISFMDYKYSADLYLVSKSEEFRMH